MCKLQMFILLLQLFFSLAYSQTKITEDLVREINEQVFDSDNRYPKNIIQSNKRFELIKGPIKEETILYSDSIKIINTYNKSGSLLKSKTFKKNKLRGEYFYEYKYDGKTIVKERGVYNLNYYSIDDYNSFALKTSLEEKGYNRYLDTLFIKNTKGKYELTRRSELKRIPIKTYIFQYNPPRYLKSIIIFKNNIRVGHLINFYNDKNQVEKQELFWDYERFYHDTGLSFVGNFIYELEYNENGIIKLIRKLKYNPLKLEWEESITKYNSVISKNDEFLEVQFSTDFGSKIVIKIDGFGNWVYKSKSVENITEVTRRTLKYFQ